MKEQKRLKKLENTAKVIQTSQKSFFSHDTKPDDIESDLELVALAELLAAGPPSSTVDASFLEQLRNELLKIYITSL